MNHAESPRITALFNIVLLIYLFFVYFAEYLFTPEVTEKIPWEIIFKNSPATAIILGGMFAIILILCGTQILKVFWNRFVSDILMVRNITFQESMAIVLLIGAIFS